MALVPDEHVEFEEQYGASNDPRLGRHILHDRRSRAFNVTDVFAEAAVVEPISVCWGRAVAAYDQGSLGSCTAHAICGAVSTLPFRHALASEANIKRVYSQITREDRYQGSWPPDDTGSDGLTAAKVAQERGWIGSYRHAFTLDAAVKALQLGPFITGTDWKEGMFDTKPSGEVMPSGRVDGGHEYEGIGVDVERQRVIFAQSWGRWGVPLSEILSGWNGAFHGLHLGPDPRQGYFWMSYDAFGELLFDQGDVTVPLEH